MAESFNDSYAGVAGNRGYTEYRTTGTGVKSQVIQTTPVQLEGSTTRSGTRRRKPKVSFIPPTPYTLQMSRRDNGYGTHQWDRVPPTTSGGYYQTVRRVGTMVEYSGGLNSGNLVSVPASFQITAERKALLKLKSQKVNLAQAFAERRMTAGLVADSLTRMANSMITLNRALRGKEKEAIRAAWKILRGFKNSPKAIPSTWLEYQYGWTPLMNDVFGACEALKKRDEPGHWAVTVKSGKREKTTETLMNLGITERWRHDVVITRDVGTFVRFDIIPDEAYLATVSSLGLSNPALIVWELMPYSFVADWFIPIGDWLSSMDATNGFKFGWGSVSHRAEVVTKLRSHTGQSADDGIITADYKAFRREFRLQRTPYTSFPTPSFPGFKDPFSATHVANALSLFVTALGGGGRHIFGRVR